MRLLTLTLTTLLTLFALYSGAWMYLHHQIVQEVDRIYTQSDKDIEFLGAKPTVRGFPGPHKIFYGGGIRYGNSLITFPAFFLEGFPVPGLTMTARFPEGLAGSGYVNPDVWSLDTLNIRFSVPHSWPEEWTHEELSHWQKQNGTLNVEHFDLTRNELNVEGMGSFALDKDLQPVLLLKTTITGYLEFIQFLKNSKLIDTKTALAAGAALNALSERDDETGQTYIELAIGIKNRMLSVGPLQVVRLPEIRWDKRNPPDARQ